MKASQVTNEGNKIFEKKEHQLIYRAFLDTLEPEKQIQKIREKLQEKLSEEQKKELIDKGKSLNHLSGQLKNEDEKKVFAFVLENSGKIFNGVNPQTKSLSEENFCEFLISVFKEIRKELANKENLEGPEIKKVIDEHIDDIRGTEAKDSAIKFVLEALLLGMIKIDPKNISGSFMSGLKEKIPFLGKDEKGDEPPLSDEERVTMFLRKSLLPIIILTVVISLGGLSGPVSMLGLFTIPHIVVVGLAVLSFAIAEYKTVKSLFSNDKKGTLYNPDYEEKVKEWGKKICCDISKVLESKVGKGEQPTVTSEERLVDGKQPIIDTQHEKIITDGKQPNAAPGTVPVNLKDISVSSQCPDTGIQKH